MADGSETGRGTSAMSGGQAALFWAWCTDGITGRQARRDADNKVLSQLSPDALGYRAERKYECEVLEEVLSAFMKALPRATREYAYEEAWAALTLGLTSEAVAAFSSLLRQKARFAWDHEDPVGETWRRVCTRFHQILGVREEEMDVSHPVLVPERKKYTLVSVSIGEQLIWREGENVTEEERSVRTRSAIQKVVAKLGAKSRS